MLIALGVPKAPAPTGVPRLTAHEPAALGAVNANVCEMAPAFGKESDALAGVHPPVAVYVTVESPVLPALRVTVYVPAALVLRLGGPSMVKEPPPGIGVGPGITPPVHVTLTLPFGCTDIAV
jgi:hypothetical protein